MPTRERVIRCTCPGCSEPALQKIAAPWNYGKFHELKTYGFACSSHTQDVMTRAQGRPKPQHLSPGESMGELAVYDLPKL